MSLTPEARDVLEQNDPWLERQSKADCLEEQWGAAITLSLLVLATEGLTGSTNHQEIKVFPMQIDSPDCTGPDRLYVLLVDVDCGMIGLVRRGGYRIVVDGGNDPEMTSLQRFGNPTAPAIQVHSRGPPTGHGVRRRATSLQRPSCHFVRN